MGQARGGGYWCCQSRLHVANCLLGLYHPQAGDFVEEGPIQSSGLRAEVLVAALVMHAELLKVVTAALFLIESLIACDVCRSWQYTNYSGCRLLPTST